MSTEAALLLLASFASVLSSSAHAGNPPSTCTECLKTGHKTHFWCASDNTCRLLSQDQSNPFGTCAIPETHDLVFNATDCCSTKMSFSDCVAGPLISFCHWCPNTTQGSGQCIYKYDSTLTKQLCRTPPESFARCSSFASCKSCVSNILCTWCEESGTCLTKESQEDKSSPYYCFATTNNCCFDFKTCEECSRESGPFDHQNCIWCYDSNQCRTLTSALKTCGASNRLGVDYCKDRCTSRSSSCQNCVAERGCVWVSNFRWNQQIGAPNDLTSLCVAGSFSGPSNKVIDYQSSSTGRYEFVVNQFYFLSCSMTSSTIVSLIIGIVVSVVMLIILVLIIITILKRIRYAKALKKVRMEAGSVQQAPEEQVVEEDSDAAEQNDIQKLIKPVSWE